MIITQEEWAKRTDNSTTKIVEDSSKMGIRRWGKDFNLEYLKNNDGEVVIKELKELEFPDGSVYKPSEKKMVHVLISVLKKPKTNSWNFEIKTDERLVFYPQGELTKEEIEEGSKRPSYIIDSFAVYKKGGQKLFHIPRAWARDAKGSWTWGKLEREGNVITKVIPQEWLDNATYPIVVDTNVGFDDVGGSNGSSLDDYVYSWQADMAGVNGTITALHFYTASATRSIALALYRIDDTLAIQTASFASVDTGWSTAAVSYDSSVDVGRPYSFAWNHDGTTNLTYKYDTGSQMITNVLDADVYSAPYTFPNPGIFAYQFRGYKISAYFVYTAAGGGGETSHVF